MKKQWIFLKFKSKSVFGKKQSRDFKIKWGHGNAMKFWNIQSSFSIRKRRTTLACNFVDGNPEPKNWQKNSRQKSLRFILRFWSEYSSGWRHLQRFGRFNNAPPPPSLGGPVYKYEFLALFYFPGERRREIVAIGSTEFGFSVFITMPSSGKIFSLIHTSITYTSLH